MILAGGADWKGFAHAPAATAPTASSASSRGSLEAATLIKLQHRHERLLRDLDRAHSLHASLAFLLPLQQFAFPGHVPAVALRKDVLSHRRDRLARDHLAADRGLQRDLVKLARDDRPQLLHQAPALPLRLAPIGDERERVDRLPGHEHVELDQVPFAKAGHLVVHRRVTLGARFQLVVEVVDDLAQRDLVLDHAPVAWPVFEVLERPSALLAELHHRPHISGWSDDGQLHVGLCDGFDHRWIRQQRRVVNLDYPATFQLDAILDGGSGCDQVELELALQSLLDDLEMKKAEEATAKTKSEGGRVLRLERKCPVVELQLLQRLFEVAELL